MWYLCDSISEGLKEIVKTNYVVKKLEQEVEFSDSITNQTNLADKYVELERYDDAIDLYKLCLRGFNKNDFDSRRKLVGANYYNETFEEAVSYGNLICKNKEFQEHKKFVFDSWALYKIGEIELAETNFAKVDLEFANYPHRLEHAKFLNEINKSYGALALLETLLVEFNQMGTSQKRLNRGVFRVIKEYYKHVENL